MGTDPSCSSKTSGCRVHIYKHGGYGGPNWGTGQNDSNLCRKDCNICVHTQGVSSYKVLDCPETVVPVGHYQRNGYAQPMGTDGPLGYSLALKGENAGMPEGWNDNMWGISFHTVPEPDANQIKYDMPTYGITADGSGTGEVNLPKQGISADRDDVILATIKDRSKAGRPCPSGTGYFMQGATKVRCLYGKTNDAALRDLHTNKNGVTNDPRASMHANLKEQFCSIPDNWTKNPGGGTCMEWDSGKTIAKQYCGVGNRIATDGSCTQANLGTNNFKELAIAYCKTATGKADQWCSCYNVTNGVCTSTPAAAGCDTKRQQFDKLVESTPVAYKPLWAGREACFGSVCQGSKYIPENANQNCNAPIQICSQTFDLSQISESSIEAKCNLTADTGTQPSVSDGSSPSSGGGGGSGGSGGGGSDGGSPQTGINAYIPTSIDDLKTDSKKQMAVGGVGILFMCCCCMFLLLLVAG